MEREKEVQTHAAIRAEQKTKEQQEMVFDQQRNAARLAKEVQLPLCAVCCELTVTAISPHIVVPFDIHPAEKLVLITCFCIL